MHAKNVLDDPTVDVMTGLNTALRVDKEALTTDGTTNVRGYPRWLA
jgi:hypothetical protein